MEENNGNNNPVNPSNNTQKGIIIGLVVVILVMTVVLAYVLIIGKAEAPAVSPEPALAPKTQTPASENMIGVTQPAQPIVGTPVTPEQKAEDPYDGWLVYRSDRYGYEIRYPSGMTVTEAQKKDFGLSPDSKMTFDEAFAKYTGQVCVSFSQKKDSVLISAPVNKGYAYVICGRTGMGSDTKIKKYKDKLTIDGKEYAVDVNDMTDSTGRTIETVVELSDGTQISFSASNEEYRAGVKKMVESYKKI